MKRSSQIALFLMGTMAVGGGAYALMPSENCQPAATGSAAAGSVTSALQPGAQPTECRTRSSSGHSSYFGGSSYHSSSSGVPFFGQGLSNNSVSGTTSPLSSSTSHTSSTSRGGFGSFAAHFSGGG